MPNGCPRGVDPLRMADEMAAKGIIMYSVGCEPSLKPFKEFFSALAFKTGGLYVPLRDACLLTQVIVSGVREALSLDSVVNQVCVEVQQMKSTCKSEEELVQAVHVLLKQCGV